MNPAPNGSEAPHRPDSFRACAGRLFSALSIFAGLNLVTGFVLDVARTRCGSGESGVLNDVSRARPKVLIIGSSRAKHHYDDRLLSERWGVKVFNGGFDGQGTPFARVVHEQSLRSAAPRVVILDVMYFPGEMKRVHALDPWYFDSAVLRGLPSPDGTPEEQDLKTGLLMRIPAYRYAGKAWKTIRDTRKPFHEWGFDPLPTGGTGNTDGDFFEVRDLSGMTRQIDALVRAVRDTGAKVVLCVSPSRHEGFKKSVVPAAAEYARRKNVPFFVFGEASDAAFAEPRLYRDSLHLNSDGARLFSEAVASRLAEFVKAPPAPSTTR